MPQFPSFNYAPSETRRTLRNRFACKLHVTRQDRFLNPDLKVTPDQIALQVFAGLKISSNADWMKAEIAYAEAGPADSEPPTLQSLANLGWLRRIWDRAQIGHDLRLTVMRAPAGAMDAFKVLLSDIHEQNFEATSTIRSDPELAELVDAIEGGHCTPNQIISRTPEWIAAKLWEVTLGHESTADSALRRWVDLWALLQYPSFIPKTVWSTSDAKTFRETAICVIAAEASLGGWKETRDLYVQQAALAHDLPPDVADSRFSHPSNTLIDRALWAQSQLIEASAYESLNTCRDLFGLVSLLLADADAEDNSPAPHPVAAQIIDLAMNRAELLIYLIFHTQSRPRLLADFLIHPPSAGLACLLIAQWRSPVGAWDRTLVERDSHIDQADAFADAVAILGEHVRTGKTDASEAAALFNWLHGRTGPDFIDNVGGADPLFETFHRELAGCASSILLAMARSLDGQNLRLGVGVSEFASVLDLATLGGIEDEMDADTIVTAYVDSLSAGNYSLSAHRIGVTGAAALARIAGSTQALRNRFLHPLDVRAKLAAMLPQDNEFTIADSIGRSLRTHIRILCRAIVGVGADAPDDLFDALISAVRTGALEHKEKGRVAAFAPRHGENPLGENSPVFRTNSASICFGRTGRRSHPHPIQTSLRH